MKMKKSLIRVFVKEKKSCHFNFGVTKMFFTAPPSPSPCSLKKTLVGRGHAPRKFVDIEGLLNGISRNLSTELTIFINFGGVLPLALVSNR